MTHAAGAGLKDIQEMLGHSSITITRACSPRRLWRSRRPQPGSCRERESLPRTPVPGRAHSPARSTSLCRLVLIHWAIFGRSTLRPLTHRSRKRRRTRGPRPSKTPP
ncbi:hypothetical protein [Streptomyces halstedii]|uniref:hypothetical protein n=1 Tax=Streptomyces halstedii TaxID=1944 RepID=UPI0037F14D8C